MFILLIRIENRLNRKSLEYINNSLKLLNIPIENYQIKNIDALQFLYHIDYNNKNSDNPIFIDLLFLDPPYNTSIVNNVLNMINEANIMSENGIIIAETSINFSPIINKQVLEIITERQFGSTKIFLLEKNSIVLP